MIEAMLEGKKEPAQIADLARRQLRGKIPELEKALEGHLTEHHRFLLRLLWKELLQQEALIAEQAKIEEVTRPFATDIERLDEARSVDRRSAWSGSPRGRGAAGGSRSRHEPASNSSERGCLGGHVSW